MDLRLSATPTLPVDYDRKHLRTSHHEDLQGSLRIH